jgi:hypothetical protein
MGTTSPDDTDSNPTEYNSGKWSLLQCLARNENISRKLTPSSGETVKVPGKGRLLVTTSIVEYTSPTSSLSNSSPSLTPWTSSKGKNESWTV